MAEQKTAAGIWWDKPTLRRENPVVVPLDTLEWVRENLGFAADPAQARVLLGAGGGDVELHPAVGELDGQGCDGSPSCHDRRGEPDSGGESERAAERRVVAQGGGV